jgi:hypothetical protein
VIDIIGYAVKDEMDVKDLREWFDIKQKERDAEEQQREEQAKAEVSDELRRKKP